MGRSVLLKPWVRRFVGISVSIFFVYLAVRRVDLSEAVRTLGDVRPILLGCATVVYLAGYPVRAMRWRLILRSQKELSVRQTLVPVFVGYMANNLLPARAGEVYRAHFLGRRARMSRSGAVASIVVERAFDGLMLVVVISLISLLFPREHFLGLAAFFTGLVFLGLAAGILIYVLAVDRAHRVLDRGVGLLPGTLRKRVEGRLELFLKGIRGVSTVGGGLAAMGYTAVIWTLEATAMSLAVISFGVILPVGGYLLVYGLAALATTLPSGPGYIGPYQYAFVLSLGTFEVSRETALAISVATQLALLGSVTVIGLALLWLENLRPALAPTPERPEEKAG